MIKAFEIFFIRTLKFQIKCANSKQNFLFGKSSYWAHRLKFSQYLYTISFRKFEIEIRCQKLHKDTENNRSFEIQR